MSEDEIFAFLICIIWLVYFAARSGLQGINIRRLGGGRWLRRLSVFAWLLSVAILWVVLKTLSASDVRYSVAYTFFYLVMGVAWVSLVLTLMKGLDWNYAEDVLERGNTASAIGHGGAVIGLMLAFAGANIGDGPGWVVVIFCAILSSGSLLLAWLFVDRLTGWIDHVTIDRDLSSGLGGAAFFIAGGLIAGRAVAGDWISAGATVQDFVRDGWGLAPLVLVAGTDHMLRRPKADRPHGSLLLATMSALFVIAYAILWVYRLGPIR